MNKDELIREFAMYKIIAKGEVTQQEKVELFEEALKDIAFLKFHGFRMVEDNRPKIICLCGSTRFTKEMLVKQWELNKQGYIVLSWCALPDDYYPGVDKTHIGDQEGVKKLVDEIHKRKIDLADEVLILNIGGYIGESTRSELEYARAHGKPVVFLEPEVKKSA